MTLRLTIGIDPGLSGAIGVLADGEPIEVHDMPTRTFGKFAEVDDVRLAAIIRGVRGNHRGAWVSACIERVQAMPESLKGVRQGGTSNFRFGESYGVARAVLGALSIPYERVAPVQWKPHFALSGSDKDASRQLALKRFPSMADRLARKKDDGRAEALLIALWFEAKGTRKAA